MNPIVISYPGGVGGNWLLSAIATKELPEDLIHFHDVSFHENFHLVHELDPTKFDYFYSGTSYFNFYTNLVWKLLHHSLNIFRCDTHEIIFLKLIDTARYVCKFDTIKDHIFFNFDDLVNTPITFLNRINDVQQTHNIDRLDYDAFLTYRHYFFQTCINVRPIYENFDNTIWVAFVLAELMQHDIFPTEFDISNPANKLKCKQFALDNYHHCKFRQVHFFENGIILPDLMNLKNRNYINHNP